MRRYSWGVEKNQWLVDHRGVSFERVVLVIEQGGLLDIVAHPNPSRYPNQQIMIVKMDDYAWLVPYYVRTKAHYFLKTIIPSRKATRKYLESPYE